MEKEELKIGTVLKHETCDKILMDLHGHTQEVNPHIEYLVVDSYSKSTGKCKCWIYNENCFTPGYDLKHLEDFIKYGMIEVVKWEKERQFILKKYVPSKESLRQKAREEAKAKRIAELKENWAWADEQRKLGKRVILDTKTRMYRLPNKGERFVL